MWVWPVPLDVPPAVLVRLSRLLAEDEHARARRFLVERDAHRFTAARGWLRTLLGRYLGVEAAALRFEYSASGKPALAPLPDRDAVHFNLAHSEELALVAVTTLGPVGVDLERIRPLPDADSLVARFFSARERALYHAVPIDRRLPTFFRLWTRKEALLKATGEGLGDLSSDRGDVEARWRLEDLRLPPGFVGALAIERPGAPVRMMMVDETQFTRG